MPDRKSRIPHSSGRVDQFVKQAHLDCSPASVRTCDGSHEVSSKGSTRARWQQNQTQAFLGNTFNGKYKTCDLKTDASMTKPKGQEKTLPVFNFLQKELVSDRFFSYHKKICFMEYFFSSAKTI